MKNFILGLLVAVVILLCVLISYNLAVLEEQSQTIKEHERLMRRLKTELEYQNNVDYVLRNDYAGIQAQLDWNELYMWQYGTDRISKAEFAAKVENNPGRSGNLLEITKHDLPW